MSGAAIFTASGGFVVTDGSRTTPIRLGVTNDTEAGDLVELTADEAFELGCWLLKQALPSDDWDAVRRRINNTPWKRQRDRADELDAMADAQKVDR